MERFRLRVRHEPKRGHIWELHLFPEYPRRQRREAEGLRPAPTQSRQGPTLPWRRHVPEAILWLRQIAEPFLLRAEAPEPIAAEKFGPAAEPRWLRPEDGMRLALAFSAARWLVTPRQRRLFREGLEELPSEVVLYWFTLCFYGYRQAAGRAALRTLFTARGAGGRRRSPCWVAQAAARASVRTESILLASWHRIADIVYRACLTAMMLPASPGRSSAGSELSLAHSPLL